MTDYRKDSTSISSTSSSSSIRSTSSSSTTTVYTAPGVSQIEAGMAAIASAYKDVLGRMYGPMQAYFVRLMRAGMSVDVILSAITATAWARMPTPYYLRAVLERYMRDGIMTAEDLIRDQIMHEEKRIDSEEDF